LVHVTDPHLVAPGRRPFGVDPRGRFDASLRDIAEHHADAAFCVITGDLTEHGDVAAYQMLKARLVGFLLKTHLLLGNCDDRRNFLSVFGGADEHGFVQSMARYGDGWHLFLDTLGEEGSAEGRYEAPRRAWLGD
jgi:3',5'-cyclic AMP phosphodiesterase CpdA